MEIFNNWEFPSLAEIVSVVGGGTPDKSNSSYWNGSIPWASVKDIKQKSITNTQDYITQDGLENSATNVANVGDLILVTRISPGETAIANSEISINQDLKILKLFGGMPSTFLYYLIKSVKDKFIERASGTTVKGIKVEDLNHILIPLPPLNEQHRIVSKIEELFSDLDNGVINLKKAKNQLKVYRQALLKNAFEGKLTEQWRKENNPESAEKLLERIKGKRQQRYEQELEDWKVAVIAWEKDGKQGEKPVKPKPMNFLPSFDYNDLASLNQLPSSWIYEKLGNLAYLKGGLTKGKKLKEAKLISLPYLRVANVQDGYLDLQEISYIATLESDLEKYKLENGDILYTEGGDRDKLGRGTIWKSEIKNCIHQNHIFRARPILGEIKSEYFGYYSQSKSAKNYFFRKGKQTTNLASINLTVLSNLPIPVAPLEESKNIVDEIESQFSVIDNLDKTIELGLEKSEALRQSILKKAFEGKLVEQDPNDEPASKLLNRIKGEKNKYLEEQKKQKKKGIKKVKKMSKELSIEEVLKTSDKPMLAKDVWQQSKHKGSIEDFYKELKKIQENIKEVKKGTESLLSLMR